MEIAIVVALALLAGGAVYVLTLRTLPEDGTSEAEANAAMRAPAAEAPAPAAARAAGSGAREEPVVGPEEMSPGSVGVRSRIRSLRSTLHRPPKPATSETIPRTNPTGLAQPRPVPTTVAVATETPDVEDAEPFAEAGVLYVPVLTDRPDANSRLMGLLGIVALVVVSGALLGFAVWQTIHVIARLLSNATGS